ncbi:MAG: ATPase, T2SS/T4P/T4SS family [Bdellovibrionales bacterium]
MRLNDLNVMDLYVRLDGQSPARYRPAARETGHPNLPVPQTALPDVILLTQDLKERFDKEEGIFTFASIRYRVSVNTMANGETWAVLRRINAGVQTMEQLGFAPHIIQNLRMLGRRDGLVIISGATGAGKTTTAFSLLNDFLKRHGGTALTIEDPVEYVLDGAVGNNGFCYQVQVHEEDDWAKAIKSSLRWTPRYLLVGEIRTPRAAEQVLRAATTGHLVITTVHAGSIEESMYGILHLAEQTMGGGAAAIMATGITAALHQTLGATGPFIRYIFTEERNNGDPIRALIRENRIGMINTFIDKQTARMSAAKSTKF